MTGWKSWLTETAKQAGVEASEEMFTEVANILSDAAIMMDRSNWALTVNGYIIQGKSAEQAKQRAFLDCVGQVALAGLGGAISGGVMGGAVNAVNGVNTARETGGRIINDPLARAMFGQGETNPTVSPVAWESGGRIINDPLARAMFGQGETAPVERAAKADRDVYTVVNKLKESIPSLSDMGAVSTVSTQALQPKNGKTMAERAKGLFEAIKGTVTRAGFGDVIIDDTAVKHDLNHGVGPAKAAVIPTIPHIIQEGRQIDFQKKWKGRAYDGYIFAAPIIMDGKPVYVAAVVTQSSVNRFYLHEVVDSNGNIIKINSGERATPTSLAAKSDAGTQSPLSTPLYPLRAMASRQSMSKEESEFQDLFGS